MYSELSLIWTPEMDDELTSLSARVGTPSILSNPSKIIFQSVFLRDVALSGTGIRDRTSAPL